jgi:phenylpropionate dioxygenase-like ring-hydroxylating dioxygenase large terminal subunit
MLEDYWHIACASKSLKRKPKALTVFSKDIAICRNDQGQPFAVEDRCAHRNLPLHCGKLVNGQLQCPYHGWTYNSKGQASNIPAIPEQQKVISSKIKITAYPCYEVNGYIWICISQNPVHKSPPVFPFINKPGWTTFRMQTRFDATVENCLENFLDIPHATFVHRLWFRSPHSETIKADIKELSDGAVAEYIKEPRKKSLVFRLLSKSKTLLEHTDRFIAPAMSRVDYKFSDKRHYIISSFCTPINKDETEVFTVITFKYKYIGLLIRCVFEPLSRLIIRQDVNILKKQQRNIQRFGEEKFVQIPQDLLRPYIISWREAISANKPKNINSKPKSIEINV